jgi:hypothetical protein
MTPCTCYCSGPNPQVLTWQQVGTISVEAIFCRQTSCTNNFPSSCNSDAQGCSLTSPCGVSAMSDDSSVTCFQSSTIALPAPTGGGRWHHTNPTWLQGVIAVLECPIGTDGRLSTLVSFFKCRHTDVRCMIVRQGNEIYSGVVCRGGQWSPAPSSLSAVCTRMSVSARRFPSCGWCGDAAQILLLLQLVTCTRSTPRSWRSTADLRANGVWEVLLAVLRACVGRDTVSLGHCVLFCLFGCLESFPSCREFVVRALMLSFRAVALQAKLPTLTAPSASAVPSFHSTRPAPVAVRALFPACFHFDVIPD